MKILGIVIAREGSRGLPGKNIKLLNGKPLIAYSVEAAINSGVIDKLIVSTDSDKIADTAAEFGADIPFKRPDSLASDNADSMDAVLHAMDHAEKNNEKYSHVFMFQPTSPLRTANDIRASVELMESSSSISVIGVKPAPHHPATYFTLGEDRIIAYDKVEKMSHVNRQELKQHYKINGAVYCAEWEAVKEHKTWYFNSTVAYIMPAERSIDIDDLFDFEVAEMLLKQGERHDNG